MPLGISHPACPATCESRSGERPPPWKGYRPAAGACAGCVHKNVIGHVGADQYAAVQWPIAGRHAAVVIKPASRPFEIIAPMSQTRLLSQRTSQWLRTAAEPGGIVGV